MFLLRFLLSYQFRLCMLRCSTGIDRKITEQTLAKLSTLDYETTLGGKEERMREKKERMLSVILRQTLGLQIISFHILKTCC